MLSRQADIESSFQGCKRTRVHVVSIEPKCQDLQGLVQILAGSDWLLCPGTRWSLQNAADLRSAAPVLRGQTVPIVVCGAATWKDMLAHLGQYAEPPVLIVSSRLADEHLWAEALNLGAYDVLAKPYHAPEVRRVLSHAWLHWKNRNTRLQNGPAAGRAPLVS